MLPPVHAAPSGLPAPGVAGLWRAASEPGYPPVESAHHPRCRWRRSGRRAGTGQESPCVRAGRADTGRNRRRPARTLGGWRRRRGCHTAALYRAGRSSAGREHRYGAQLGPQRADRCSARPCQWLPALWEAEISRLRIIRMLSRSGYSIAAILRMLLQLDEGKKTDLRRALDIPRPDEDAYLASDRWLSTLAGQEQRAHTISALLEEMMQKQVTENC